MRLRVPMTGRDPGEAHRVSTPLELFFDLTFVVAIAQASSALHHGLIDGHAVEVATTFPIVFFAIWWAWVNFTWFASAYDTDDALYRIMVFFQMAGVLILAAGTPRAMDDHNFNVIVLGYIVMRLALVAQWERAAISHPERRKTAHRFALGIVLCQVGWIAWLAVPAVGQVVGIATLIAAEMAVPIWAESAGRTGWHPHHIAERYGLFTIIVLGESILSATVAVQEVLDADVPVGDVIFVAVAALLVPFSMWWIYFDMPTATAMERARQSFASRLRTVYGWAYGHYFIFGGAAAAGAGLVAEVDRAAGNSELSELATGFAFTVPVSLYLLAVWLVHYRFKRANALHKYLVPTAIVMILASSAFPHPVFVTGILLAIVVAAGALFGTDEIH